MPKQRNLHFDEAIADSLSSKEKIKEEPINDLIFRLVLVFCLLLAGLTLSRVFALTVLNGDYYSKRAFSNVREEIPILAPRGIVTDRRGLPLVENQSILSVLLRIDEMIKSGEEDRVLDVAEQTLSLNRDELLAKIQNYDLERSQQFLLAEDITLKQAIAIKSLNLNSLTVEDDYKRHYKSPAFAHIVGYVGKTTKSDLAKDQNLSSEDTIGKAGLETYYDNLLRGQNGEKLIYRNNLGKIEKIEKVREVKIGSELKTTIDAPFQEYFYNRLLQGLASLGRNSGVGLAINPQNGEVLALASLPSFDANNPSKYLNDPNQPLFNRAVSGVYNPGSVIKPIHATAVLNEGVIDTQKQIFSPGYIELPNPFDPEHPSRFLDWRPQGWVDLYSAIARSSNVYFYEVVGGFEEQKGIGIDKIIDYWKKFGLDQKTSIDLPAEGVGFLPNPQEKEKRTGTIWRIGDTYNIAIGQGDLSVTPLELLNAIMAVGTGKAYKPHLFLGAAPKIDLDLSAFEPEFKEVRRGMIDGVIKPYGTANSISNLAFPIAAKTGSAQTNSNTKINALFVGYTPTVDPEIAILILVENAREGSLNTLPIAHDVLRWYYENRILTHAND